jgi:hypothetical protein
MRICQGCFLLLTGLVAGCENPHPSISQVAPNQAYSSDDLTLTVEGDNFVPATIVDPEQGRRIALSDGFRICLSDGARSIDLVDVTWLSPHRMTGWLAGEVAKVLLPGPISVEVVDPRGERASSATGFYELGPDQIPPTVVFDSPTPDSVFVSGMLLRGTFHATDAVPGRLSSLRWTYLENDRPPEKPIESGCMFPEEPTTGSCDFQISIGPQLKEGDVVTIVASAEDDANPPNLGQNQLSIRLAAAATVSAIWPTSGGTSGGTEIVVTGTGFVPGATTASVDGTPLFPNGGIVVDSKTLTGHVPPHAEGFAPLLVRTPLGLASGSVRFEYLSPPQIDSIYPEVVSAAGGTLVTVRGRGLTRNTIISFGPSLADAVPLSDAFPPDTSSIAGKAPAGVGRTTVWAFDAELGYSSLIDGFAWSLP